MIESSQEIEIRKYLNLAEQHEKNGDLHATKEALLEAQVSKNKKLLLTPLRQARETYVCANLLRKRNISMNYYLDTFLT